MDNIPLLQELKSLQNLSGVVLNHRHFEALVLLVLYVLEQVLIQKLEYEYLMITPP
jgi:hypothetical protein